MGTIRTAAAFKPAQEIAPTHHCRSCSYSNCETSNGEVQDHVWSAELVRAEERCRMGRELHDSTSQLLVSLQLRLGYLKHFILDHAGDPIFEELESTMSELHREIRLVSTLNQPPEFEAMDLPQALKELGRKFARMTGLAVSVDADCEQTGHRQSIALAAFRIAQEALANVYRHASASTVEITLRDSAGLLQLSVRDDGIGISPEKIRSRQSCGLGLSNIHARAKALDGTAVIRRLGQGTEVKVSIPHVPDAAFTNSFQGTLMADQSLIAC